MLSQSTEKHFIKDKGTINIRGMAVFQNDYHQFSFNVDDGGSNYHRAPFWREKEQTFQCLIKHQPVIQFLHEQCFYYGWKLM